MAVFLNIFSNRSICFNDDMSVKTIKDLKIELFRQHNLPTEELRVIHNGRHAADRSAIESGETYHITLPLNGGKGGFGSMLRMLGAQIEKTTNHEACRDLSGRRMRDVNNEKKLVDWLDKKAELEKEREEKRKAKLERMRSQPRHVFVDPSYDKQKKNVLENLDSAITQGLQASTGESSACSSTLPGKRKHDEDVDKGQKKSCLWMGVDINSDSEDENEQVVEENSQEKDVERQKELLVENVDDNTSKSLACHPLLERLPLPKDDLVEKTADEEEKENEPIDLEQFSSACELESAGLERLKLALVERGLKCGGTLQERASRLYSVKGLALDDIDASLVSKGKKGKKSKGKNGKSVQ